MDALPSSAPAPQKTEPWGPTAVANQTDPWGGTAVTATTSDPWQSFGKNKKCLKRGLHRKKSSGFTELFSKLFSRVKNVILHSVSILLHFGGFKKKNVLINWKENRSGNSDPSRLIVYSSLLRNGKAVLSFCPKGRRVITDTPFFPFVHQKLFVSCWGDVHAPTCSCARYPRLNNYIRQCWGSR